MKSVKELITKVKYFVRPEMTISVNVSNYVYHFVQLEIENRIRTKVFISIERDICIHLYDLDVYTIDIAADMM